MYKNEEQIQFVIIMSFGFSVGDFLAVLRLAKAVHERFSGAPDQFKAISKKYVPDLTF